MRPGIVAEQWQFAKARNGTKSLLRIIICGSVDDGKSTLIGRLLHDWHLIPDDQHPSDNGRCL
jgi:GTPase